MSTKDVVTWTWMIYAYGMYSEGLVPDGVVFIFIINACSHSGLPCFIEHIKKESWM
uniref:T12H20.14 protein n=1 Tax=Arabidopsis thaliana TaxID=3702 RepID=O82495_ARATH|nr:T12H20.14 gene product [Arabidopsis thaliana]